MQLRETERVVLFRGAYLYKDIAFRTEKINEIERTTGGQRLGARRNVGPSPARSRGKAWRGNLSSDKW